MLKKDKRIRIIIGHYGSGKTEFSLNYALRLADESENKVAIVDLDLINLYFRSREKAKLLEDKGIRVISSSIEGNAIDIPAVSGETFTAFQDESYDAIVDVGGDPAGARALGRYNEYINVGNYDMFFILNVNRQETQSVDKIIEYIRKIEDTSRNKITGLVSNSHLLQHTTKEDVLSGYQVALEVSKKTGIPLRYISALEHLIPELPSDLEGELFPIKLYMREEWML